MDWGIGCPGSYGGDGQSLGMEVLVVARSPVVALLQALVTAPVSDDSAVDAAADGGGAAAWY